ncbi:MAG: class I SAM-dependent methyltransferase, partial [Planctomycetota bacterium]
MQDFYDQFWQTTQLPLRHARSLERAQAVVQLLEPNQDKKILDLGCGCGVVGEYLKQKGFEVVGVELSSVAAQQARNRGLKVIEKDVFSLEWQEKFPTILALEFLEHLPQPQNLLQKIKSWLTPNGKLIASLPNEFHLLRRLGFAAGYFPFEGHHYPHLHLFSPHSGKKLLLEAGYSILQT